MRYPSGIKNAHGEFAARFASYSTDNVQLQPRKRAFLWSFCLSHICVRKEPMKQLREIQCAHFSVGRFVASAPFNFLSPLISLLFIFLPYSVSCPSISFLCYRYLNIDCDIGRAAQGASLINSSLLIRLLMILVITPELGEIGAAIELDVDADKRRRERGRLKRDRIKVETSRWAKGGQEKRLPPKVLQERRSAASIGPKLPMDMLTSERASERASESFKLRPGSSCISGSSEKNGVAGGAITLRKCLPRERREAVSPLERHHLAGCWRRVIWRMPLERTKPLLHAIAESYK